MRIRLILGLLALTAAVAFALAPADRQSTEYTWEPAVDGSSVPLLLIERTPDEFGLSMPCGMIDGTEGELFASSGAPEQIPALTVRATPSEIVVEVPESRQEPRGPRASVTLQIDDPTCEILIGYDRARAQLTVHANGMVAELSDPPVDAFRLTGFHWLGADLDGVRAVARTSPQSMVRNSSLQKGLLAIIALLAVAGALSLVRGGRRWSPRARVWRLDASEWSMLFLALIVALLDLPRVDDGRILSRARLVSGTDLAANVEVLIDNRIMPQRWLYEWILGTTAGWSDTILVLRLPSALAVFLAWILIRRRILPALTGAAPTGPIVTTVWAVHALFVVAWSATLRPEPFTTLLIVAVLAVLASWPRQPRAWPYGLVVGCAGLAVATHPAGVGAVFAGALLLWRLPNDLRRMPSLVFTGAAWGAALSVIAMFLGSNLWQALSAGSDFRGGRHQYGPLDVHLYLNSVHPSTAPITFSAGIALVAGLALLLAALWRLRRGFVWPADALILAAGLSPLGLLFTPSKWVWHVAILGPLAIVGWAMIAVQLEQLRRRPLATLTFVTTIFGLLMALSLRAAWHIHRHLRETALREVGEDLWSSRLPWLFGWNNRWWIWVLFLFGFALLVHRLSKNRGDGTATGLAVAATMSLCVATVSVVQLTPPVADAVVSGSDWTFVRQSVVGIASKEAACGVPAATPVLREHYATDTRASEGVLGGRIASHPQLYMYMPCHRSMSQRDGAWQIPTVLMGPLAAQQELWLAEYEVTPIGCHRFPRDESGSLCFSRVEAEGEPLRPSEARWFTDPFGRTPQHTAP